MTNLSVTLFANGGFDSTDSEDIDLTLNSLEIADGAAGSGVTITNVDAGANLDFAGAKLTNVGQATAAGDIVVLDAGGRVPASFIPDISVTSVTVVADITARDALTVGTGDGDIGEGDVVIVNDDTGGTTNTATQQAYIYTGSGYVLLQSAGIISINGSTNAVVVLTAADIDYDPANPADWVDSIGTIAEHLDELASRVQALEDASAGGDTATFTNTTITAISARDIVQIYTDQDYAVRAIVNSSLIDLSDVQVGIAAEAISFSSTGEVYIRKGATISGFAGLTPGAGQYMAAGGPGITITETIPTSGNVYRIGVALSATELLFDPRFVAFIPA